MGQDNPLALTGIRIDIETRSRIDVKRGSYVYSECPDFQVLLVAYATERTAPDGSTVMGKPRLLDLGDPRKTKGFQALLGNPKIRKYAFNANFERICLSRWAGMPTGAYFDPESWHCTAVQANVNGVFGSLNEVAKALRSPVKKDPLGDRLIQMFSKPNPKTGEFFDPELRPEQFTQFGAYCERDVLTEATVASLLPPTPAALQELYAMDQRINDRGIGHHRELAAQAMRQVEAEKDRLMSVLKKLTGLDNPNSLPQLHRWLEEQGYPMDALDKEHREIALADPDVPELVTKALTLKGKASLSSVTKHKAALATCSEDGRIRGSLQFYGAHTGREAGRGIQPQNLPRYQAPDEDIAKLVSGNAGKDAPRIAKGSVRASLIPAKGNVFVVTDYNSIEARMLGWLADEDWVNEVFRTDGKLYEATASTMFNVPKQDILDGLGKCGKCESCEWCQTRSKGKTSALGLGYAGGAGALVTMGAEASGIDIGNYKTLHQEWAKSGTKAKFHEWQPERHDYPELIRLRDLYREASPRTVSFWKQCALAWDRAALLGKPAGIGPKAHATMMRDGKHNRVILPSGRSIWYRFARAFAHEDNPSRIDRRIYIGKGKGVGQSRIDTHGGKLTENITQAAAVDVLFDLMLRLEQADSPAKTVLHVHDEVVQEVPEKDAQNVLDETLRLMSISPPWAGGLILKGEGKIMERYGK